MREVRKSGSPEVRESGDGSPEMTAALSLSKGGKTGRPGDGSSEITVALRLSKGGKAGDDSPQSGENCSPELVEGRSAAYGGRSYWLGAESADSSCSALAL